MLLDLYPLWKKVISFGSERVMWPARRAIKRRGSTEKRLRTSITHGGRASMKTTTPLVLTVESHGKRVFDPQRLSPELRAQIDRARRDTEDLIELLLLTGEL